MSNQVITPRERHYQAFQIALSGFLALVVAMGIGRFTFTPQVPLMIAESQMTLTGAGIVAAFNYLAIWPVLMMQCGHSVLLNTAFGAAYGER